MPSPMGRPVPTMTARGVRKSKSITVFPSSPKQHHLSGSQDPQSALIPAEDRPGPGTGVAVDAEMVVPWPARPSSALEDGEAARTEAVNIIDDFQAMAWPITIVQILRGSSSEADLYNQAFVLPARRPRRPGPRRGLTVPPSTSWVVTHRWSWMHAAYR